MAETKRAASKRTAREKRERTSDRRDWKTGIYADRKVINERHSGDSSLPRFLLFPVLHRPATTMLSGMPYGANAKSYLPPSYPPRRATALAVITKLLFAVSAKWKLLPGTERNEQGNCRLPAFFRTREILQLRSVIIDPDVARVWIFSVGTRSTEEKGSRGSDHLTKLCMAIFSVKLFT